ncbi:MAG: hypothetical protein ED557_11470 [Balneola sp.]|nr:MAG: hypothetical protein ED557_11470 [Balneola sp.]
MNQTLLLFVTLVVIVLTSDIILAQGLPGLPGFPDDPAAAPIDGGLGILAAAGGAYALKKLRDKNKEEET